MSPWLAYMLGLLTPVAIGALWYAGLIWTWGYQRRPRTTNKEDSR